MGSLFLTRPTLAHYTQTPEELQWRAGEVLAELAAGTLNFALSGSYALADAGQAHRDLEARKTSGKVILIP
jgi:NADPH2:quinone reductase